MTESALTPDPPSCALVLLSGGMDPAACSHLLGQTGWSTRGLFLAYGQAAVEHERRASRRVAHHLGIDVSELVVTGNSGFGPGELPGRNAFFVFSALFVGKIDHGVIALGIHSGNNYYDCSPAFVEVTDRLIAEHTDGQVRLLAPLINWTKRDVIAYCRDIGIPSTITYSCETGTDPVCGKCASCLDRSAAEC